MRTVSIRVSADELEQWRGHATTQQIPLGEWIYRAVRLVLETDILETTTITGRPKRLLSRVVKCVWCGGQLGPRATRRRRFCSDACRVRAWRHQSVATDGDALAK